MSEMLQKSERREPQALKGKRGDRYVIKDGDTWVVRKAGATKASGAYRTKMEAIRAAKDITRAEGGELRIQGRDGRFQEALAFTIGREPFSRISAVEKIYPTKQAQARKTEFDSKKLSSEKRRQAIIKAYRPKG